MPGSWVRVPPLLSRWGNHLRVIAPSRLRPSHPELHPASARQFLTAILAHTHARQACPAPFERPQQLCKCEARPCEAALATFSCLEVVRPVQGANHGEISTTFPSTQVGYGMSAGTWQSRNLDAIISVLLTVATVLIVPGRDLSLWARLFTFVAIVAGVPTLVCAARVLIERRRWLRGAERPAPSSVDASEHRAR